MVAELGGPTDLIEHPAKYIAAAPVQIEVYAASAGSVAAIDTRALGIAVILLGGGRKVPNDVIDHRVGLTELAGKGAAVDNNRPLAIIHAKDTGSAEAAAEAIRSAFILGEPPTAGKPVRARIAEPKA